MPWAKATSIYVPTQANIEHPAVFFNTSYVNPDDQTFYPVGSTGYWSLCGVLQPLPIPDPGIWNPCDITPLGCPDGAIAADIGGFLIITNGNNSNLTDIAVAFQTPNGPYVVQRAYCAQGVALTPMNVDNPIEDGGELRTVFFTRVPLVNNTFWWGFLRGNNQGSPAGGAEWPDKPLATNSWPAGAGYLLNCRVEGIYAP